MLQSQGLRAATGGGLYIPPEPGEYLPAQGGYFAGHMGRTGFFGAEPYIYQIIKCPMLGEKYYPTDVFNAYFPYSYSQALLKEETSENYGWLNGRYSYSTGVWHETGRYVTNGSTAYPNSNGNYPPEMTNFRDWYIPAVYELHQMWRFLMPGGVASGGTRFGPDLIGSNPAAIPAFYGNGRSGNYYTYPTDPSVTDNPRFQEGGDQAFRRDPAPELSSGEVLYQSSTVIGPWNSNAKLTSDSLSIALFNPYTGSVRTEKTISSPPDKPGYYWDGPTMTIRTSYIRANPVPTTFQYLYEYYETYQNGRFRSTSGYYGYY